VKRAVAAAAALALTAGLTAAAAAPATAQAHASAARTAHTASAAPVPEDTTDPVRAAEYWLDDYGIRDAWNTTRGAGTRIAIIDTGVGAGPVEFAGVAAGTDVSGEGSPDGRSPVGGADANHGSWVASLAGSRGTGDGGGMIGVAPEAELLSVSVGFDGTSPVPFVEQIANAIRWSVDNGAGIINMSLTTNTIDWDRSWDDAFQYAFDNDVVIIVAAGNRGNGTQFVGAPATIPGVVVVGGVDADGRASVEASTQGITIALSAPSERLLGVSADGTLVQWQGTSGAAPIVAGIAALVRSAHPGMNADNVINRLIRTARPAPDQSAGRDVEYGYGLVDAAAAVSADVPMVTASPLGLTLQEWVRLYRRADAEPVPQPTATPVEVAPLPEADEPHETASPLLPNETSLVYGTVPLMGGTVAAIMIVLGLTAVARRIRLARESRTPSQPPT
jgi:membrane-anchored mycosin MYCP